MAKNDEITSVQSFTERTLKYGRNVMAVAVPIFVFALVPVVDLATSRPLNFAIQEGGEIWIWRVLLALLTVRDPETGETEESDGYILTMM